MDEKKNLLPLLSVYLLMNATSINQYIYTKYPFTYDPESSTMTLCVKNERTEDEIMLGTMAILGSIESGINGNHSILYAKSVLDGVLSIVLASSLGVGVLFSAASVFIYQGSITMFALWLQPFITTDMLREIGIVGGILVSIIGLNLLEITKIKVGNMLPAIAVPVIYYIILSFV